MFNLIKNNLIVLAIIALAIFSVLYFSHKSVPKLTNTTYVKIAGKTIKADLATTTKEQEQGLSGRSGLKEDEGMLFVFSQPAKYSFWMKDMNFPIDMIWISEDMHVIYIKKNADPSSYPAAFGPEQNAKYVLEVVSGFAYKNNLKEGSIVEITK